MELFAILIFAVSVVFLFRKLNLPAILAYLVAGTLVGEHGLALAYDNTDYDHFAEMGIVFLLFTLGLEFSLPRVIAMRQLVFRVGGLQVILSLLVFTVMAMLFGQSFSISFVIASILALSSTAIVIRQLSDTASMKRQSSQISVAILLFQDIAVVPLLIIIPMLAQDANSSMAYSLFLALLKGVFVVALLMFIGKSLLPKLFNLIAQVRSDELFVLTTLLVTLAASSLTQWFGLSMALGAFLAGMMLGESEYKHQLEANIRPYRDILLGLFFITVGMKLDISYLLDSPLLILGVMVGFMVIKIVLIKILAVSANERAQDGYASGIMLAQMGEFGFVLIALANQVNVLPAEISSVLLGAGIISMSVTPYMVGKARAWSLMLINDKSGNDHQQLKTLSEHKSLNEHVIICGFGRVGQTVSRFLRQDNIPFVAIDIDPLRTAKAREAGENVLFGSSREAELLHAASLSTAKLVVIAFGEDKQSAEVIEKVRSLSSNVPILVRTRNDDQLAMLKKAGANEVVPESLEGNLMLVSQVLSLSGVPFSRIIKHVQKERKSHYNHLHGFFQGEQSDLSNDGIKRMAVAHAIVLNESSYAVNQSIEALQLANKYIDIITLKRANEEIDTPEKNTILLAQDTIILRIKEYHVEKVERFLQEGK